MFKDWIVKNLGMVGVIIIIGVSTASVASSHYLTIRDEQIRAKCERAANKEALEKLEITLNNMSKAFNSVATNLATLNTEVKSIKTEIQNSKK